MRNPTAPKGARERSRNAMFTRLNQTRGDLPSLARVEGLIRAQFGIAPDEIVLVSQDVPRQPGFPDQETNIVFWKDGRRHRLRLFLPLGRITARDLPPAWMLPRLEDDGTGDCC